jgi:Flp pilus assembly pilin Flp
MEVFSMLKAVKSKMQGMAVKTRRVLTNNSGDQMTGWLIVVLIVVVVGAVFMTLYQDSISEVWNSIVAKITGLIN